MGTQDNVQTVRDWVETAWNRGDVDADADIYAANYNPTFLQPPFSQNLEGLKAYIRHFRSGMPDLHFAIEDIVADENNVVWRVVATGTQTGDLLGFPPTGRSTRVDAIIMSRFENGTWAEDHVVFDALGMMQQLGLIPQPEAARA